MKTQIKKSISLFLAVLMVLSCWVWVAPQEAEAAKYTPLTQYTVELNWTISQRQCDGGDIQYKTLGDGWGTESGWKTALSSLSNYKSTNTYTYSWTTTEFPTVVKITTKGGFVVNNPSRCAVNYLKINGKTVFDGGTGKVAFNLPTFKSSASGSAEMYPNYTSTDNSGTSGNLDSGYNWPRPMIAGFNDDTASASDIAVTLNQIGGQNITKTADFDVSKYTCYDQYGVKIANPATFVNNGRICTVKSQTTHVSGTKNSDDGLSGEDASDIYAESDASNNVIIKPNLQISNPKASTGAATYYLVRKYVCDDTFGGEITSKVSAAINVTYPKYTVTFDGGLDSAKIVADKEYTKSYAPTGYHGTNITLPSKTTADGYTFYEYWSKPQPASGAASYNVATADFAKPCSSEDYASYLANGGSEKDGIVTDKDGGKWYDAGKKLDPSSAKTIDVSENKANFTATWYAWWLAKDLSVKFYDVDGTFLGEKLVKSGQTQSAIEWPTSKYINSGYTTGAFKFKVDGNIWEAANGTEINKNSYTFTKDLILTPKLTRESFQSKYTVTFINPNNGTSVGVGTDGTYDYRADIKSYADTAKGKIAAVPSDVDGDLQYRYELLGWSSVAPTTGKNYHVLLEDADFDVNGTAIGLNSDWVVRNEATYYAVYRRYTQTYVVNFTYKDATGADANRQVKFKYGDKLVAPTDYVPYNYVTKGFGYTFANWEYTNANGVKATFAYNGDVAFNSTNFEIAAAALDDGVEVEPIVVKALYGAPVATPYSVTFNYVVEDNKEDSSSVTVKNEEFILQGTVDNLAPAEKWENEDQLYTYADKWEITEGSATVGVDGEVKTVGAVINTADLITLTPTSNLTFKAVYANPVPYYTVTYVDGTNTFTDRALKDSAMPKWTTKVMDDNGTPDDPSDDIEKDELYVPADYEGEGGTYVFQGWFDAKEGGNKVEVETAKLTGNITLYSQFKFVPDKFLIQFMNHDGTVQLGAREYEKGQNIEALVTTATKAAQGRAKDDTYEYVFLGWDKAVPTFCEGYAVTYTALYKPVYRYYEVKWYNSVLVDGKWVADKTTEIVDEKEVEKYLLATTKHTYNSKLNAPSVATTCSVAAPAGQTYVFAGWYYNDAEGNAVKYERGMPITAEMEFYATYTLTDKTYTVTTIVKGSSTKYTVAANNTEFTLSDPVAGYVAPVYEEAEGGNYKIVDGKYVQVEVGEEGTHNRVKESCHDAFEGWYTDAEHTTKYVAEAITADITLYAKFKESDHDLTEEEVEENPTYFTEGTLAKWCECNKEETKTTEKIAKLTDKVAPTGKIYLGGLSWSSTDEQGANATDGDEISIFTNKNTDIIITANDKGDVNALYNPAGLGSGIKVIRAFAFPADTVLTVDNYGAAQAVATDIYVDNTTAQNENATFAVKLGDIFVADLDENGNVQYNDDDPTTPDVDESETVKFKPLVDGEDYIIYYYVNDKATTDNGALLATGNQLNRKVRTAKFHYDNTAPVFTIAGDSNNAAVPTYCGVATVTGIEKGAVVTVNGEDVTPTEEGKYVINYTKGVDNFFITATDKSGNTFSKKIKVADHSWYTTEKAASCGVEGYKKTECLTCREVKVNITYDALAHHWTDRQVIPADCVNNGKVVVTCSICGEEVVTEFEEDGVTPVIPALGHEYAKNVNGEIDYSTVTESTCQVEGLAEAYCTVCGDGRITKDLDLNPNNHVDITISEDAADCVNAGYYKEVCVCGEVIKEETYPATGHGTLEAGTAEWYVTLAPTCYQAGSQELRCTICTNAILDENDEKITEEIAATGEHVKTVTNPDTYKQDGAVKYHCATEGCTHKYADKPYVNTELEKFTVTFKAEDDTVIATFTQLVGTGIKKDAVTAPEKAATTTKKYSFAGWADKDGKIYKLPLTVEGNLELKATYKATPVYYAHQFVIPTYENGKFNNDKTTEYRALLGAIGDERVPSGTPVVPRDGDTVFTFEGWTRGGKIVTDFTIGIEEGDTTADKTFVAKFSSTTLSYEVIFYNGIDYVWNTSVKSGEKVTYDSDVIPTKAFDSENHYTFNNTWLTEDGKVFNFETPIIGKTRLYADYTATKHTLVESTEHDAYVAATCTAGGVDVKVCSCGYYETTKTNADGHDLVEYTNEEGVICQKCNNCDYIEEGEAQRYTVKFTDGKAVIKLEKVVAGNKLPADLAIETPTKDADAQYTYAFNDTWICNGVEYSLEDILAMEITSDMTFEADYDETLRYYNVSYLDADNKPLETKTVAYGEKLYACTKADPTKDSTELEHFTFTGWDKKAGEFKIVEDTVVRPVFKAEKHKWVEIGTTDATCEEAGGTKNQCSVCKLETTANSSSKPALGHTDLDANGNKVAHTIVLPTNTVEGSDTYKCTRCGKDISGPVASTTIKITVKDKHGNLATDGSAIVTITSKLDSTYVQQDGTGLDGTVTFRVPVGHEWIVGITGSAELPQGGYGFELGKGQTEYEAAPEVEAPEDDHCSCSCHKTSFWGIIYRLFQKFIAIFRGEIRCCADPDPMYNK